jgi:hypothetical protein
LTGSISCASRDLPKAFDELGLKAIDWKKLHRYSLKFPQSVRNALQEASA